MTPKELKRLSRGDLLEILLELSRENEQLRQESARLRRELETRTIAIEECGSIAEAALQLSGIFQAAQAACEQYTQNIRERSEQMHQLEAETKAKCDAMLAQAWADAQAYRESEKDEHPTDQE